MPRPADEIGGQVEAIRKIVTVKNNRIENIDLPMFNNQEVIVTISPFQNPDELQKELSLLRLKSAGGSLHNFANSGLIKDEDEAVSVGIVEQYGSD
jgi:hypothetical protein